jgi:chitinase
MMTYDHYGPWSETMGHHASLYSSSPTADDSLAAATRNMLGAGVPPAKLVAGVAMYSRGFEGVSKPATGAAKKGPFPPGPEGAQPYRELAAQALGLEGRGIRGYSALLDPVTQAWALWNPKSRTYIGYDDPRAVMGKGRYVKRHRLAGLFAWELSQDNGDILNAMNLSLGKKPLQHPKKGAHRP